METRKPYPTDLNDKQWQILQPLVPSDKTGGRPSTYEKRHIINAILYVLRTGSAWRMLPNDVPPWGIVYHYFRTWRKDSTWERIHDTLRGDLRGLLGRPRQPSAACMDAPSVKPTDRGGAKGFDSAKQVQGRKRHILVATLGLLLAVLVTAAGLQDRDGAKSLLGFLRNQCTRLRRMWADGAYAGALEAWVQSLHGYRKVHLDIVRRAEGRKGFVVLPKRWIVERTLGWFGKYRRLSKDYEYLTETSVAAIGTVGKVRLPLLRLVLRTDPSDCGAAALQRRVLRQAGATLHPDAVLVVDAGFGVADRLTEGVPRFMARVARNFTARCNVLPAYKGRGRRPTSGARVRPLPRTHKGKPIAATPPDATAQWGVAGRIVRAQGWHDLVLATAKPGAATFRGVVIHDPRSHAPLVVATNLPLSAYAVWGLSRDRWPIEQVPLAAKQMRGAHRAFVCGGESRHRLPELGLLAGNVLMSVAATTAAIAPAFGIGATVRRVGACVGCYCAWIFPRSRCRKAHCGKRRR